MFQKRKASPALALPPFPAAATYTNWELSADRANAARRLMQQNGIRSDQITEVRGFADQRLRKPQTPSDPANRRISLIVQYIEATDLFHN